MGKRLEKARERLKRGLAGAGILLGATQVSHALESVTWASAPTGLASKAALVAAGGIAVGTKFSAPVIVLLAILALGIGTGGGYMIAARRSNDSARVRELEREMASLKSRSVGTERIAPGDRKVEAPTDTKETAAPPAKSKLAATLEKYKSLKDRNNAKWKAWSAANPGKGIDSKELSSDSWALYRELKGVREQIFEDPKTFLDFLSDPANEKYVWNLFDVTLTKRQGEGFISQQEYAEFPAPLTDGLLGLLTTGSLAVRDQVLAFMRHVTGQPDTFKNRYLDLLHDPNISIIKGAAEALGSTSPLSFEEFSRLSTVCESSPSKEVRQTIILSMWRIQTPESRDWRLSALESGRMPDMDTNLAGSLMTHVRDGLGEAFEDRFVRGLSAALSRTTDEGVYIQLLQSGRMLAYSKSKAHFELAAASGPTAKVRDAAGRCLELINAGRADWKSIGTILNEAQARN